MSEEPKPKPKRKLKPRDPKKVCGAKTPNGPCQQWKGFKTSHPGTGRCNRHGGSTPNQTKAADQEIVETRMRTYGAPIETDPLTAILQEVARTAGHVAWLEAKIASLRDGVQTKRGPEAIIEVTMFGKKPTVWMKLYQDERAHLARVSKVALDNGVAEKMLDVMKQNGRALGEFIGAVLHDERIALTPEQMEAAKTVVQELMQKALNPVE